jgi:hypothetical protein
MNLHLDSLKKHFDDEELYPDKSISLRKFDKTLFLSEFSITKMPSRDHTEYYRHDTKEFFLEYNKRDDTWKDVSTTYIDTFHKRMKIKSIIDTYNVKDRSYHDTMEESIQLFDNTLHFLDIQVYNMMLLSNGAKYFKHNTRDLILEFDNDKWRIISSPLHG